MNKQKNIKTKIITRFFITLVAYINLYIISVTIYFILNYIFTDPEFRYPYANFVIAMDVIFAIGIIGAIPLFGDSPTLLFFPFAPLIFSIIIIFIIVNILEKWKIITNHKKIFLSIFILSIILFYSTKKFNNIQQEKYKQQIKKEESYIK